MLGRLLLIFVLLAFVDLMLLIQIGQVLGLWATLALVMLTGMLGTALARRQGLQTLAHINTELAAGRAPTAALADGAVILLAAVLLITPGFLTDVLGLAMLVPPLRRLFRDLLARWFQRRVNVSGFASPTDWVPGDGLNGGSDTDAFSGPRPVKHVENEALRK
ncbi:MAG TPA: FxsA family protein [Phycisphaerae bacterium]|nr:FxsA family protein [Phycisphaerae bacterium]